MASTERSPRVELFDIPLDNVTLDEALDDVTALCSTGRSHLIVTFNVDHLVTLQNDADFRQAYADASMRLIDGSPIVAVAKLKRTPVKARVPGSDLMPALCERAARDGLRTYVVGGMPEANQLGVERLRERNPGLVIEGYSPPWGFESNPEHTADVLARINEFQPDLLFMCTGAPKSEKWVSAHLGELGNAVAVCAGAAIDFEAGTKRRAPKLVRIIGLEWAFRLAQEPRRLWHRYLVKDAAFFPMALREIRRK
ncbi:MAG: WecB/TagA/CpsF family glycosyltransferase [Acidimicrobiia bacterium]